MTPPRKRLLMVGPALSGQGGVVAVCRVLTDSKLAEDYDLVFLGTVADGSMLSRAWAGTAGVARALLAVTVRGDSLVHLHVASRGSFWRKAWIAEWARFLGKKTVVHLHGALFHEFAAQGSFLRHRAVARLFRRADAVVVLSETWAERVAGFSNPGTISVVPNPVEVPPNTSDREAPAVLFAGRLGRRKGVPELIEAFTSITRKFPGWKLVLAGDGEVAQAGKLTDDLGAGAAVQVLGWQDGPALARLRAHSSVFCLPSHDEGLPVALLEAMAAGLCCVVTPVGGVSEHVVDRESGRLVAPGDPAQLAGVLADVMADSAQRVRLGDAARAHVIATCSTEVVVDRLEAIYTGIGFSPEDGGSR